MGGLFIPNPQPQRDPWSEFMQAFLQGQQLRQRREVYERQFQSETEDRKLRQQALKLQLDAMKLEGAHREKQQQMDLGQMLMGMPGKSFGTGSPQVPVPGMATDLQGGMAPETMMPSGGPPQSVQLPFHNVPGPIEGFQVPSQGETQRMGLEQLLAKLMLEAQAKAPYEAATREDTQAHAAQLQAGQQTFTAGQQERGFQNQKEMAGAQRAFDARQKDLDRKVELEKTRFERDNKGLAAEGASRLAVVKTLDSTAEKLKPLLKGASKAKLFQISQGLDPRVNRLIDDVVDADIRIRTGAAANRDEIAERRGQIIRMMDVMTGNTAPMLEAINAMQTEARRTAQGIDPGGRFGGLSVPGAVNPNAPAMVKYQGKTVPFASLPPAIQQQVLALQGR